MPTKSDNIIEIKNLKKKYGDFEAVKWITFDVKTEQGSLQQLRFSQRW